MVALPQKSAAGLKVMLLASRSVLRIVAGNDVICVVPLKSVPLTGAETFTAMNESTGLSCRSLKPKLAALSTTELSSFVLTGLTLAELDVPCGASLIEATLIVNRRGVGSRLAPPLARLPLSRTWKLKFGAGLPLESAFGVKVTLPATNSLTGISEPLLIGV